MTSPSNYPLSTSAWYAQSYYNAGCEEVENLCSECGKPCDEPTCKLCLEGIAEMIAIMDDNELEASCGNSSTAASSGNSSTAASSGRDTIAMAAGRGCTVQAGENGCFAAAYWDEKSERNRILTGHVGEEGIIPNTPYLIKVLKSGKAKWEVAK